MELTKFEFSVEDGVARITINDPDQYNTVSLAFTREFAYLARQCQAMDDLRVVVLAAKGDVFSFGGDIDEFIEKRDEITPHVREMADLFHDGIVGFRRLDAPIVVAVNGMAAGGGFSLVLMGDISIAKRSATFNIAYTRTGLTPDGGSTFFLPRQVGYQKAFDIMGTNPTLSADEMQQLGVLARVVDDDDFEDEVEIVVGKLLKTSPEALARLKGLLRASMSSDMAEQMTNESESISSIAGSKETTAIFDAFKNR